MVSRKVIHCIGDSHTSFFTGYNKIQPEYPSVGFGIISNVLTYRIGAPLAYNLCEAHSKSDSNKRLFRIVNKLNPERDILLLSFGEIDCRAHLLKQAALQNRDLDIVLNECVDRYIKVICQLISMKFTVCVWNAIPTAMIFDGMTLEYPYYGNYVERNKLTAKFNQKLMENQEKYGFQYYGIFHNIILPDWTTNEKYYFDNIHLNNIMLPEVLSQVKFRNGINFHLREILWLKIKITFDNRIKGKNRMIDYIWKILSKVRLGINKSF